MNSLGDSQVIPPSTANVHTDNDTEFATRIRRIMNVLVHSGDVSQFHRYDIEAAKLMLKDV